MRGLLMHRHTKNTVENFWHLESILDRLILILAILVESQLQDPMHRYCYRINVRLV